MGEEQQPKLEMVFLADARTDPRTMVVEFPHAFTTVVAVL